MRKVISNTTPILSLLKLEKLDLLEKLYTSIIIPKAVWQEIEIGREGNYYQDLSVLPWIEILTVQNEQSIQYLTDLDPGEAEVIVLAREMKADLVIIDESLGRSYAQHFGLTLTGTLGLLLRAKKEGHIDLIAPLLAELKMKGVWLNDQVIRNVLLSAGE
jgi:predicted nucleic acid-binding protein